MGIIKREGLENEPRFYEAFQYRLTNIHKGHERYGKQYSGVKKGYADVGYTHSAKTNAELKQDLAVCDFEQQFENFGTFQQMKEIETTELRKAHLECPLKENPDYYNNHVGSTSITHVDYEAVKYLYERIETGEFNCEDPELVPVLMRLHRLQVRVQDNGWLARDIADSLKSNGLDTRKCNPILIYEGVGKNKQDIVGDGNTTLDGCDRAHAEFISTIRIPNDEVVGWGEGEYRALSNLMNPRDEIVTVSVSKDDAIKYIVDLYRVGNVWDSPATREFLKNNLNFSRNTVSTIMSSAKHEIECIEAQKSDSVIWMDMSQSGRHRSLIEEKQRELNPRNPVDVKAYSSAKFNWDTIMNLIYSNTVPDPDSFKKHGHDHGRCPPYVDAAFMEITDRETAFLWDRIDIIIYHSTRENKKNWDQTWAMDIEDKLDWLVRHALPGVTVAVHEMEMEQKNVLNIDKDKERAA